MQLRATKGAVARIINAGLLTRTVATAASIIAMQLLSVESSRRQVTTIVRSMCAAGMCSPGLREISKHHLKANLMVMAVNSATAALPRASAEMAASPTLTAEAVGTRSKS
jgi:hypothetical protein